mmetsp:Transcript_11554/g.25029  ORF Transcript_11554/g.25029 Transcript_11554/m.25029 type:complete len:425 (-) Transcript_11554:1333-2607(-)
MRLLRERISSVNSRRRARHALSSSCAALACSSSFLQSSGVVSAIGFTFCAPFLPFDNFILPFCTDLPPPLIVPLASINFPSTVTTLHRFPKSYAHLVAVSKSGATRVFPTARNSAGVMEMCPGLMRSNNLGAPSGVSTALSCAPFFILSSGTKLARPRLCFRRNWRHFCVPAVVWTTMLSSMPHAVDTATSYLSSMVARSPRRPMTPHPASSPPFLEAFMMADTTRERPVVDWIDARATSTCVRRSVLVLANVISFSPNSFSSPSASPTRSFPVASSSLSSLNSALLDFCLLSSDDSSFSDFFSCSDARDTVSSSRLTSICAVSSEFWKTVLSCRRGASSCVFSSSSRRSASVVFLTSSKTTSSLPSSSALRSAHSSMRSSSVGMLSSASSMADWASSLFFVSATTFPSNFLIVPFSCLIFSFI